MRQPITALVEELAGEFGEPQVFRPYRDTRFSKDKTPYKDRQGALVAVADGMGYYVQIGPDGLTTGGGYHHHAPDQVARYRDAVDDRTSGAELRAIIDGLRAARFEVGGDRLKTKPRGVADDHPRLDLLKHKSLVVWRDYGTPAWMSKPAARDRVQQDWQAIRPLGDWLAAHVGPTTDERMRMGRRGA